MDWLSELFRFGGAATIAIDDSSTPTRATDEQQKARVLVLTGTLTATRVLELPLKPGADWVIWNATSSANPVTVKGASGTGVNVASGGIAYVVTDGTNFRKSDTFDPAAPGGIGSTTPAAGTFTTCTATSTFTGPIGNATPNVGKFTTIDVTSGAVTFGKTAVPIFSQPAKDAAASSQAGQRWDLNLQPATAGNSTAGAAAGGTLRITTGIAARLTSGDAAGGDVEIILSAGIGAGRGGRLLLQKASGAGGEIQRWQSGGGVNDLAVLGIGFARGDGFAIYAGSKLIFGDPEGSTSPTLTFGTAAPSASEPDGSIYIRLGANGTFAATYHRIGGAWNGGLIYEGEVRAINGGVPNFGIGTPQFTSDADHTVAAAHTGKHILVVTSSVSLTATRSLILPLVNGALYRVKNSTTGGQSITVRGATGTGHTIANGQMASVFSDGTNYYVAEF